MKTYSLVLSNQARKYLRKQNKVEIQRLRRALKAIQTDPTLGKILHGKLQDSRSYRVGHYRIIYNFDNDVITVRAIKVRDQAYR